MYSLLHLPDYAAGLCIPTIASVYTVILIYPDQKKKGEFQKEALPKNPIQLYYATVNLSTTLSNAWSSPI